MKSMHDIYAAFKDSTMVESKIRTELNSLPSEEQERLSNIQVLGASNKQLKVADELVQRMVIEGKLEPKPVKGLFSLSEAENIKAGLSEKLHR